MSSERSNRAMTTMSSERSIRSNTKTTKNVPVINKDSRSFRPNSISELNAMNNYKPLVIQYTKHDGTVAECHIGCGNSLEDLGIIFTVYVVFYSFLIGFFALLLKGALDTEEKQTILWSFFFFGVLFVALVGGGVYVNMKKYERERNEKKGKGKEKVNETNEDMLL
mmetsp:Transcript_21945/g.27147  ORF Transcript_21945/g.27147 Transcript_21945/m.27147 type:complete len:166 (+) Transcript_21945:120-617(+)|eukprot:CAMPEP_0172500904 /NCGR_PEP_ID=MMETSP1066-20121228/143979_1 /TAXON_ID=671091 /ORGANISM="Coscinodiscus wailesii, Strain CCMP2513" /LENGTH=165 /DNA_ID=CAMNT_0013275389 /DNA_START=119 /DNA_END=616 /DNA_ORIENTATION=-